MPAAPRPHARCENSFPVEGRLATLLSPVTEAGGHCVVESLAGSGETLSVLLPMARADFERALAIPQASGARPDRLLLVFRDPTVRFFIGALLQAVGLSVTAVTSIEEAMDVLQQPNLKIQLVLADRDECDLASWVGHYAVSRGLVPPLVLAVGTVKRSGGGIRYALSRDNALQPKMLDGAGLAAHVRHCLRR